MFISSWDLTYLNNEAFCHHLNFKIKFVGSNTIRNHKKGNLLRISHNVDSIRFDMVDQFLSSQTQHGRFIGRADQEDFLAVESLSEVNEGCFEAVFPVADSVLPLEVNAVRAHEYILWEGMSDVGTHQALIHSLIAIDFV